MADNNRPAANAKCADKPGNDGKVDFDDRSDEVNFACWPKKTKKGDWYLNGKLPDGRFFMMFMNAKDGWSISHNPPEGDEEPSW